MQRKCWIFILITVAALAGLGILIFVIVYITNRNKTCATAEAPYIESIKSGTENILVTWYEPPSNAECNVSYRLQYTVDFGDEEEIYTTGNSYALPAIPECSYLNVRLWIISEAGEQNDNSVSKLYRELPNRGSVTDIQFSSTEEGLEVTWTRPTGQGNCKLYYDIEVTSDIIGSEKYYSQTSTENITIPNNIYCFVLDFFISPYAIEVYIDGYVKQETYINNEVVKGIDVKQSLETSNQMIVTWAEHSKHRVCSLIYLVISTDDIEYEEEVHVQGLEATFTAYFCAQFYIIIMPYTEMTRYTGRIGETPLILDPTQINEISGLDLQQEESEQLISWEAVPNLNHCEVTYKIDFITDIGNTSVTTNETFYEVPEGIYCFSLQFQVQAVVGEAESQPTQSIVYTYAQAVTGLAHKISSEDSSKFIVSWDGHPREESCSLEYRVAYSIKDEVVEIITTSDHEAIFDINDCVDASVSVTAYSYSGLHNDAATIVVTECNGA